MKQLQLFKATTSILVGIALPAIAQCQTYSVSGPVPSVYQPVLGLSFSLNGSQGGVSWVGADMNETATIDPAGQTVQQTGSLNSTASGSQTASFTQIYTFAPVFPNPPQTASIDTTLTFSIGSNLSFSFDTGAQPMSWGGGSVWRFTGEAGVVSIDVPVVMAYSLTTGGQTYSGSFNYDVLLTGDFRSFSRLSTAYYPNSIDLSGFQGCNLYGGTSQTVVNLTAANGVPLQLVVGEGEFSAAPEPNCLIVLGYGLFGWHILRRRQA